MTNAGQTARARLAFSDLHQKLLDTALEGICSLDLDGRITEANRALGRLLAIHERELPGRRLTEFSDPAMEPVWDSEESQRNAGSPRQFEHRFVRADGAGVWGLVAVNMLAGADGHPVGTLVTVSDISHLKEAEAALAEANQLLRGELETSGDDLATAVRDLAATTAELEAFSYSVSHDLRAPLRAIEGFGTALVEDFGEQLPAAAAAYVDRIRAATTRMGELIDALLGLSRISRRGMAPSRVDASALTAEIVAELRSAAEGRQVTVAVEPGVLVTADRVLLRTALENLLGNAWKFASEAERPRIALRSFERCGRTVLAVEDNGPGFDMRFHDRLFRPFERLTRRVGASGHGIGLSIVQRVAARHGGSVWAESVPGAGSTFYLEVDMGDADERPPDPPR